MPEFNLIFYIVAELAIVLLVACLFLAYYVRKQQGLVKKLEEKVVSVRESLARTKAEADAARQQLARLEEGTTKDFVEYLSDEIDSTLNYHHQLNPDRDIVLDIAPDSPIERQVASLRHAFLIAEKEARYAGGGEQSNWDVLQVKLQQIVQFYAAAAAAIDVIDSSDNIEMESLLDPVVDTAAVDSSGIASQTVYGDRSLVDSFDGADSAPEREYQDALEGNQRASSDSVPQGVSDDSKLADSASSETPAV